MAVVFTLLRWHMKVISSARTIPGFAYFEEFTWLRKPFKYPALGDLTSEVKHVSVQSAFNLRALTTVDGPLPKRGPFAERPISVATHRSPRQMPNTP